MGPVAEVSMFREFPHLVAAVLSPGIGFDAVPDRPSVKAEWFRTNGRCAAYARNVDAQELHEIVTGDDSDIIYHYTTPDGLHAILATQTFRLSPFSSVSDPRESKEWKPKDVISHAGSVDAESAARDREIEEAVDRLLRRGARLGCFTASVPSEPSGVRRGWARPAMWSHYAAGHRGACLVFDQARLAEAVSASVEVRNGNLTTWGRVTYTDAPLSLPTIGTPDSVKDLTELLDEATLKRDVVPRLYMEKNTDWASECEWRVVVNLWDLPADRLDEPILVPWHGALVGVILGEAYGPRAVAERLVGDLPVIQCSWTAREARLSKEGS